MCRSREKADGCNISAWRDRNSLRRKESDRPFPVSPPGTGRGGRVPPTPKARCAPAKSAGTHRCYRLPPQEGYAPLCIPQLHLQEIDSRRSESEQDLRLGTFYFAGIRNFLLCVDKPAVKFGPTGCGWPTENGAGSMIKGTMSLFGPVVWKKTGKVHELRTQHDAPDGVVAWVMP